VNFMRLSEKKGAHSVLSSPSGQEIRVREMAKKCEISELSYFWSPLRPMEAGPFFWRDDADVEFAAPEGSDDERRVRRQGSADSVSCAGSPDSRMSSLEAVTCIDTIRGDLVYGN